jgi:hypothetical protein
VTPISAGRLHVDGEHGAKQVSVMLIAYALAFSATVILSVWPPRLRANLLTVLPTDS